MEEEDRVKRRRKDSVNWSDMSSYPPPPPNDSSASVPLFPLICEADTPFESWHVLPRYKVRLYGNGMISSSCICFCLNNLQIKKIIGHGSYGEVAEAYDTYNNNGIVAIKRMKHMFENAQDATRAYREMHILR